MLDNYDEILKLIMREINDIVYMADIETYELLYLNNKTLELIGAKEISSWLGKPCYKILQNLDEPCSFCTNLYLNEHEFYCWEHYNQMLKRYFDVKDKLVEWNGRKVRLEIATDNTEKHEIYQQLEHNLIMEKTLVSCIRTLTMNSDLTAAINNLLEIIGSYYAGERAYIFECDYENRLLVNTYEWCREGIVPQIDNLKALPLEAADRWMDAFRQKGEFYITMLGEDVDKTSAEYAILEPQGVQSLMAAPLMENQDIIGLIGVDNPNHNMKEMVLLQSVSFFVVDDIKKKKLTSQLITLSYKDTLTGVWNRNKYLEILYAFELSMPNQLGIIYADINGLKNANDLHGHQYGDCLIRRAAQILNSLFANRVYRIGGDEFVILYTDISHDEFTKKITHLYKNLHEEKECSLSIGFKWVEHENSIHKQIVAADEMMYADKQRYYREHQLSTSIHKDTLSQQLLREIHEGLFFIYLQPKIDLQSGELMGAEALVRRRNREGKVEQPIHFISKYETNGTICYIDMFVLEKACQLLSRWNNLINDHFQLSINMSRRTLIEHDIMEKMKQICTRYGVPTNRITIEVIETMGTMDKEELGFILGALNKAGFYVSLGNFGSVYSNIAALVSLQFHEIKLDKNLINKMMNNERAKIIVSHAIDLCQELDISTSVAEGIEREEQLHLLEDLKCKVGQGYLFDKPLTIERFEEKYIQGIS